MATESTHGERPSSGVSTLPPGVSYTATAAAPVRGGGRGIGQHIRKRSGIFGVIGNPRYSTFAHMQGDNPIAAAEHARVEEQRRRAGQRVTVLYDYVNPPKLEMRFSQLGIPGMAQLERAWNYAAGAASASAASLGLGGFGLGRSRNESGTGTGSSGTGPRSPPIRWNTSSSHVRTMTNPTIMSSRVAIENAQPGSVPPMPMPRPMPAAQMAGPSGSGSGAGPSGSRSPTRSISVRANKSLYKQRPEYFDFTYPPQQPQQSTSQLATPMPFPFPRGSAQSQALSPTQSPPPTSGYTPRAVVRPDSDVLGSPDGNPFADQAASPLPPSSRHRPTASASQSTSSLPVPPRPSQSRSTSNLTPPEIHVSSTGSGARNPKTISTGGVTTSSSGNGQDSTLGADPEETERILAQFPETPRTGPLNLMASTSSFRQNVRGEDDTTAFGVGGASGRPQRDSNYTDVIPISLASSPGPYSAGDGTFGGHQMENTRLGLPPANPHAHTLGNLPRTPSFEGGDDGSTFLQPTPGGSSFDSGRDEARIMTVDARGRMSGIQAERASASSSTALGFGRQAQQRSIQNLSQLRARGNRGSFLDLSEATGSEFTRQDSGPFEDDPNGGETTPFDLLAVGGGPLPPAIERDSIDFPRIEAPDSSAGSDRSQDPFDDSQASGSGYGPSRVDSQVLTDADLLQPPAQMDTLPPLPASQQRLDMRHQRIPTSELAPLNVFRDRFEERRRARSSASGSEGATHSAVTDEPPSALLAASPMDMTASGSGSGKRDTGGSSVASFFLGSPSTADSSRVPRGDTRVSLSSAMMPTGVHPERGQWSATISATPPTSGGPGTGQGFSGMMSGPAESPLVPPQRGAAWSNMDSERKTPSPDVVPSEIEDAERRGSVMFGVAR
ncbi:hypothetical protein DL93DRAFT_2070221 [Clavulina sp. PMI_390]|nr:hypothetical protein DL93DRAFT_2070221 [Clavulina sp. PMI_390]